MWIRERISSKLEGWKANILNQAGKEVLIKAVIQAIPTYAMSIIQFPKNFCKGICSKIARFWWRSNNRERGMHWKAWKSLTIRKREGGMGFKDFNIMNSAHLAKQAWRVIQNPTALWVQVLQSIYYPNGSFIQAGRSRNDSWVWASLVHGKKMLLQQSRWLVGTGEQISITQDLWLASGERVMANLPGHVKTVSQLIDQNNCCWNIGMIRTLFDNQIVVKILQTPIQWFGGNDKIWWPFTRFGEYTVKTGY